MLGLYDVHLAPDGRRVDYPALVRDPKFTDYVIAAGELQKVRCCDESVVHKALNHLEIKLASGSVVRVEAAERLVLVRAPDVVPTSPLTPT